MPTPKSTAPPTDVDIVMNDNSSPADVDIVMNDNSSPASDASCSSDGRIPVSGMDGNVEGCSIPVATSVPLPYFMTPCARGWHWRVPLPRKSSATGCHPNAFLPHLTHWVFIAPIACHPGVDNIHILKRLMSVASWN